MITINIRDLEWKPSEKLLISKEVVEDYPYEKVNDYLYAVYIEGDKYTVAFRYTEFVTSLNGSLLKGWMHEPYFNKSLLPDDELKALKASLDGVRYLLRT